DSGNPVDEEHLSPTNPEVFAQVYPIPQPIRLPYIALLVSREIL
ncbi:unnamed protein product, partial [marine sediment metagenome]